MNRPSRANMNNLDARAPDGFESILTNSRGAPRRIGDSSSSASWAMTRWGSFTGRCTRSTATSRGCEFFNRRSYPRRALLEAAQRRIHLSHPSEDIGRARSQLRVTDGIPYLVWPEARGWTLEFILARARAGGWGLPVELALLIAQRTAAQVEQARIAALGSRARYHGILWPGFVGITEDAVVDVAGFGLADIILPSLSQPAIVARRRAVRRARDARDRTGRRKIRCVLDRSPAQRALDQKAVPRRRTCHCPAGGPTTTFSQDVSLLLHFALCEPSERFASVTELHACLAEIQAACPFETSPADLALFSLRAPEPGQPRPSDALRRQRDQPVVLEASSGRLCEPRLPSFLGPLEFPALLAPDPQPSSTKVSGHLRPLARVAKSPDVSMGLARGGGRRGHRGLDCRRPSSHRTGRSDEGSPADRLARAIGPREPRRPSRIQRRRGRSMLVENVRPRLERSVARRLPARGHS